MNYPAFIYDEVIVNKNCQYISGLCKIFGIQLLYSIKSSSLIKKLECISSYVSGFSSSSLFEAILARELLGKDGSVHLTTPGIRHDEIDYLCDLCDYISFNSLNQWERFKSKAFNKISPGLRVNPKISFVQDKRYNPSNKHSKLGVPLEQLIDVLNNEPTILAGLEGVHFHANSESTDFSQLLKIVLRLDQTISPLLQQVSWINLGGGYYFNENMDFGPFGEAVNLLKTKYDLDVIIEPGTAIVQEAGSLISEVIDIFDSDGRTIAVLDTTVNHLPEVLEFQYQPEVKNSTKDGQFECILAGASCLAGDIFGSYKFRTPLEVGSHVTFTSVGAYSLVKTHMFNGINLPSVYFENNGEIELIREYNYEDFLNRYGTVISECLRKRA